MTQQRPAEGIKPPRQRASEPPPFTGLTPNPSCAAGEQATASRPQAPGVPPPLSTSTRGRKRRSNMQQQFCPAQGCLYFGWLAPGHLRANGHPPWRPLAARALRRLWQLLSGDAGHAQAWAAPRACPPRVGDCALAAGLGIRAVARVFEVAPNTVLAWGLEAADHAAAFSQDFFHASHGTQGQLDELFALLRAVKDGVVSEAAAIARRSRAPPWGWGAMAPIPKLLLALAVGARTVARAQSVVPQVAQGLAPGCVPLFLTEGFKAGSFIVQTWDSSLPTVERAVLNRF
jgi:hypothetical protein